MYSLVNPPASVSGMKTALENYYPAGTCEKITRAYDGLQHDHVKMYGVITSDVQVRAPIRALCKSLVDAGIPPDSLVRYRSAFRAKCIDKIYSPSLGVVCDSPCGLVTLSC